jgi:hypothetical protein
MRWRLRRGDKGLGTQGVPSAPPSAAPTNPPAPSWAALPPIAPSWAAKSPLTTGAQPIRPPLTQDRTQRPARRRAADGAPEPGRVIGLAAVVKPAAPEPSAPAAELPAYFHQQPPLRHVTARPITEHAPLTAATGDYVGEPVAPAPAPSPARVAQSFYQEQNEQRAQAANLTATTEAGAKFQQALANLHKSGLPRYIPGGEEGQPGPAERPAERPAPVEPPPASSPRPPSHRQDQPPMTHRRNSLAESRRLGLGAPMRGEAESDGGESAPPPAASQPQPTAPAAAAPEPAPPAAPMAPATATPPPEPPPPVPALEPPPVASAPVAPPVPEPPDAPPVPESARTAPRHRADPDDTTDSSGPEGGGGPLEPRPPLRPIPTVRPVAGGDVRAAARTTPLVFRAAMRPAAAAPSEVTVTRAPERAVVSRPPAELAHALRTSHGVDVADVPVRRDSDAGSEARQRQARAFTRGATVYLPDDAGPVTSPTARGLLAHELVHAAQQRRFGGSLPGEDTTEGRVLEAEALAAERMYSAASPDLHVTAEPVGPAPETPLVHATPPVSASWVEERIVQHATTPPPVISPSVEPMRADIEKLADYTARQVVAEQATTTTVPDSHVTPPVHIPGLNDQAPPGLTGATHLPLAAKTTSTVSSITRGPVPDENQREQQYLDVINAEHTRRGEPTQLELDAEDRERMYELWGNPGTTSGGGGAGAADDTPRAKTYTQWVAGQGFVSTGPDAEAARSHMRSAWGTMGGLGAALVPTVFAENDAQNTIVTDAQGRPVPAAAADGTAAASGAATAPAALPAGAGTPTATATTPAATAPGPSKQLSLSDALKGLVGIAPSDSQPAAEPPIDLTRLDMEELSVRIYNHLRRRLRQELLVDRERAGLLTDYR